MRNLFRILFTPFEKTIEYKEMREAQKILERASKYDLKLDLLERVHHDLVIREQGQDYRHEQLVQRVDNLERLVLDLKLLINDTRRSKASEESMPE